MEFAEHKEYTFWDSIKNIDWKTSAKTDSLQVKKYEEERDLNVLFILDNSESMSFWSDKITKKDILEEIFYSLSFSALQNNDNIWAFIYNNDNSYFVPHKKSKSNIFKILQKLDEKMPWETTTLSNKNKHCKTEKIFEELVLKNIRNNLIFVLTDDTNIKNEKLLKLLSNDNEIIIINIFDYLEKNLELLWSNISLNNNESFINIDINKKNKTFSNIIEKKIKNFELFLTKNKVWYIEVDSKSDIYKNLLLYFNKIKY